MSKEGILREGVLRESVLSDSVLREDYMREEQKETSRELCHLLVLAQEMGRRLTNETHGELYSDVRLLTEHLHDARTVADTIKNILAAE